MKSSIAVIGLLACLGLAIAQNCSPTQWECANGNCINPDYRCDGDDDCGDASDESLDPSLCPDCRSYQWRCDNGKCISAGYRCDKDNDCGDWSDESEAECPCSGTDIHCKQGPCIPDEYWCDLIWDCPDGSDETNCTRPSLDKTTRHAGIVQLRKENTKKRHNLKQKARKAAKRF